MTWGLHGKYTPGLVVVGMAGNVIEIYTCNIEIYILTEHRNVHIDRYDCVQHNNSEHYRNTPVILLASMAFADIIMT